MPNERNTEAFVRDHFKNYGNSISLEEQQSRIPKIQKLLQHASKKGDGQGYPEFILTYYENSEFITVVECKSETRKHESSTGDKFSEFAVDGALLYSSYLSKEYDVLAIAVSGEDEKHAKVSHFLHLKNEKNAVPIFGNELLSPNDYLQGYLKSDAKFRQDYNTLLDFSRQLNETLHSHKILESQRSLLISCILIALEDEPFKVAYKKYYHPSELANYLVDTVVNNLKRANIQLTKLDNLNIQYSFIRTDTSLSSKQGVLKQLIDDIDANINSFIKNHEFYDVLGQLYIEFLRYANSDKGLGIVLTPPHITELFCDLAQIDKHTVVYDNCTGTGGFLISAMSKMVKDAEGDLKAERSIKEHQLFGVEYQAHIFALACSNMFIHQDGKTNILNGDCFDQSVIDAVKTHKPTVGLLNPPYKANKKNDIEELEFVLNNLECLEVGGTCIAIVPMQCALAQNGKVYELKKRLLERHTLEAVLSMPDDLFINSKVGVVSAVMIWTAHKPHSNKRKTYFGYYKDDGYAKQKNKGRIDAFGKWKQIKNEWVSSFIDKDVKAGFSVKTAVSAKDEWCAEAYMETDYSNLNFKEFKSTVMNFLSFSVLNEDFQIINDFLSGDKMKNINLDTSDWHWFRYDQLFTIERGRGARVSEVNKEGQVPFITSIDQNNGLKGYVDNTPAHRGNVIGVNRNGSVGEAFYQPKRFCSTEDVHVFVPKFKLNQFVGMFLVTLIKKEKYRYSYGRKWGLARMRESLIKLPVTETGSPDWKFMEDYIKSLPYSSKSISQ